MFEEFATSLLQDYEESSRPIDPEKDAARVRPRLVPQSFFGSLPEQAELPRRPLGATGLWIVYVLDSALRVSYITRDIADELKLSDDALHELAMSNLRATFPPTVVRGAIDESQLVVYKTQDTYDATRLLLVPEHLHDGEALIVAVPDRDTLAMIQLPRAEAKGFPMTPDDTDHLLLNKPLWVTKDGIEIA